MGHMLPVGSSQGLTALAPTTAPTVTVEYFELPHPPLPSTSYPHSWEKSIAAGAGQGACVADTAGEGTGVPTLQVGAWLSGEDAACVMVAAELPMLQENKSEEGSPHGMHR